MIYKDFKIPIYGTSIRVCIAEDLAEAAKKLYINPRNPLTPSVKGTAFNLYNDSRFKYGVLILLNETTIDVIVHEALHATNMILHDRGLEASFTNDEAQAYLLDYIVEKIYPFILKNVEHGKRSIKKPARRLDSTVPILREPGLDKN